MVKYLVIEDEAVRAEAFEERFLNLRKALEASSALPVMAVGLVADPKSGMGQGAPVVAVSYSSLSNDEIPKFLRDLAEIMDGKTGTHVLVQALKPDEGNDEDVAAELIVHFMKTVKPEGGICACAAETCLAWLSGGVPAAKIRLEIDVYAKDCDRQSIPRENRLTCHLFFSTANVALNGGIAPPAMPGPIVPNTKPRNVH